jgi:secretion/DNA translocation related CpaE-like protein
MANATVIGVIGGSGGVGATSLSAAVAVRAAAAGRRAACVDGDPLGGGLDVSFGLEQEPGLRWPDLARVRGTVDGDRLLDRLPRGAGVAVLSFERQVDLAPGPAAEQVVLALRSACEVLVLDLPRAGGALHTTLVAAADAVLLLVGNGVHDLAAAQVMARRLSADCADLWLAVRCAGRTRPGDSDAFATSVAHALDLPLIAAFGTDPGLAADLLHGIPPGERSTGGLTLAADRMLAQALLAGGGRAAS